MSRGLGKRQREVLQILYDIEENDGGYPRHLNLVYDHIKYKLFPEIKYNPTWPGMRTIDWENQHRQNVARVTISNAVKGLVNRGLVKHTKEELFENKWSFDKIYITDAGKEYINLNSTGNINT